MPLYQQILFALFCFLMLVVVYWQLKEREILKREQQRHQNLNHDTLMDRINTLCSHDPVDHLLPFRKRPQDLQAAKASAKATDKVIKLLRKADPDTYIGATIHAAICEGRIYELIHTLQEQGRGCPTVLESVIGHEAFEALMRLKLIDQGVNV